MKTTYTLDSNGVLYPNFLSLKENKMHYGTYADLRESYLKNHNKSEYYRLLTKWKLTSYLSEIEEKAEDMEDDLVSQMARKYGVTQELRDENMFRWISMMNSIKTKAREIVIKAIIEV